MAEAGGLIGMEDLQGYAVRQREPVRGWYRGFEIVGPPPPASSGVHVAQMLNLLERRGVKPIEAVGTQFDPRFHEAVVDEVSDAHREGEVMAELRKGYTLGERLLRPAAVKVAKA